jgi:hypothetical protein
MSPGSVDIDGASLSFVEAGRGDPVRAFLAGL